MPSRVINTDKNPAYGEAIAELKKEGLLPLDLPLANRVEPANMSDPVAGSRLLAGLVSLWPTIRTVIADAGHTSHKLAGQLQLDGWRSATQA